MYQHVVHTLVAVPTALLFRTCKAPRLSGQMRNLSWTLRYVDIMIYRISMCHAGYKAHPLLKKNKQKSNIQLKQWQITSLFVLHWIYSIT